MEPNASQGCVATYARFVGILNNHFFCKFTLENRPVRKLKSAPDLTVIAVSSACSFLVHPVFFGKQRSSFSKILVLMN